MKKFFTVMATTTIVCLGVAGVNVSAEEYEVRQQDTLWDIAVKNDTTVQTIMDENNLESTTIVPSQRLSLDGDKPAQQEDAETYKIKAGDTLSEISATYNVSVSELKEWNELSSSLIVTGQTLQIKQTNNESTVEVTQEEAKEEENQETKTDSAEENEVAEQEADNETKENGKTMTVTATAYTAKCEGCTGITSTGLDLNADPDKKVIAVDPNVIPLGTEVYVEGYGKAIAGDVGGAIKGNKIDIHVPTKEEANSWGVQTVDIEILN